MANVRDELLNRAVAHAVFLERLKAHEVRAVVKFLEEQVYPDLNGRIENRLRRIATRGFDVGPFTTQRLKDLRTVIREQIRLGLGQVERIHRGNLRAMSKTEAEWAQRALERSFPLNIDFVGPSAQLLQSTVSARPMLGRLINEWWKDLDKRTVSNVTGQIMQGIGQGESVQQMMRRIRGTAAAGFTDGVLQTTSRGAAGIVRTTVNHVTTQARELTYAANGDVVKGVRYVATLDDRTTITCIGLDGQVFPVNSGPRPPMHPLCRSSTVPEIKSLSAIARKAGVKLRDIPPGQRASITGPVSEHTTYPKWLKAQSLETQNKVLGTTRAQLWRSGKVKIDRFVAADYRPMNLDELRKIEGLGPLK